MSHKIAEAVQQTANRLHFNVVFEWDETCKRFRVSGPDAEAFIRVMKRPTLGEILGFQRK